MMKTLGNVMEQTIKRSPYGDSLAVMRKLPISYLGTRF